MNLNQYLVSYQNTLEINNAIHTVFTSKTDTITFLKEHRDYIEQNNLGFGDRAFHYMWYLILNDLNTSKKEIKALEIGVFKGQVISLWKLISTQLSIDIKIDGITPLAGEVKPKFSLLTSIKYRLSKKYKERLDNGDFYEDDDYLEIISSLFHHFNLKMEQINLIKGYSTDQHILFESKEKKYDLIYIDGDHTYNGVTKDIMNYSPLINIGGILVMDDASCNIPGTSFWKGHQAVSDACESLEKLGFKNILNVGHNRVFKKVELPS